MHLHHQSQQIEQLYGPLLSLIEQIFSVWRVREGILKNSEYSVEKTEDVKLLIWKKYGFAPLHIEIASLLRTKLYLLEGSRLPESFSKYLEHAKQEECQHLLWDELQIDTSHVPQRPWPDSFYPEVKSTLQRLMDDRQKGLSRDWGFDAETRTSNGRVKGHYRQLAGTPYLGVLPKSRFALRILLYGLRCVISALAALQVV